VFPVGHKKEYVVVGGWVGLYRGLWMCTVAFRIWFWVVVVFVVFLVVGIVEGLYLE